LPEYRIIRRQSPVRHREHVFAPLAQSGSPYVEAGAADYSESRSSPRSRFPAPAGTRRFVENHPLGDGRDLSHTGAPFHQPVSTSYDPHETAPTQSRHTSYLHSSRGPAEAERIVYRREMETQPPTVVSRVYEPIVESRAFDGRIPMDYQVAVRDQNAQTLSQEYRTRYAYDPASNIHGPLEAAQRQRVLEYNDQHLYAHH